MKKTLATKLVLILTTILMADSVFALNPRRVFKKKCTQCHTIGAGEKKGPDLANLENKRERQWVVKYIVDSKNHKFTQYSSPKKMDQLLEYIYALGAGSKSQIKAGEGSFKAGRYRSSMCVSCHGPAGYSRDPEIPHLRGQSAKYLIKQLKAYRDGSRVDENEVMHELAKSLTDRDIVNISTYYSELNN